MIQSINSVLNIRIQQLILQKDRALEKASKFSNLRELLLQIKTEASNIFRNSKTSISYVTKDILTNTETIVKFFDDKIRLNNPNTYETGDEIKLSYSDIPFFAQKLNNRDIALYQTKDQAFSGGTAGLVMFSGGETGSISKVDKETTATITDIYTETEKFNELYKKLKDTIGSSPLSTKDFTGFNVKVSQIITKIDRNELNGLNKQIEKLNNRIVSLQNLSSILASSQIRTNNQISFIRSVFK